LRQGKKNVLLIASVQNYNLLGNMVSSYQTAIFLGKYSYKWMTHQQWLPKTLAGVINSQLSTNLEIGVGKALPKF
jgi:hypothetical protein